MMNREEPTILKLGAGDLLIFEKLIELFREIFEMGEAGSVDAGEAESPAKKARAVAGGSSLAKLLEGRGFWVYAALYQDQILGGLTAYELPQYYAEQSEVYIYDIAVSAAHQRRGIGKALLSALLEDCRKGGIASVFVDADEADEHALDFYHATGGKAADVVQFTYRTG
jgi:aminoglycoside 3-N-acetyltransferase I